MNQSSASDLALNAALAEYLGWIGDPVATLVAAVEADPGFILGHTTIAALNSLGGVKGDAPQVKAALAAADNLAGGTTPREKLHLAGAKAWAAGDITGAAASWEAAVKNDPRDLLALRLAHDTHFFLGASEKLRDVPLSVMPAYDHDPAKRGYVLGMAAFGLEETGDYTAAENFGREAVSLNPADSWAIHAVAHVLEMQDRPDEGVAWLRELEPHWVPAAGLAVHQWWHAALFLIELGRLDEVLALYDANIRGNQSALTLDLVDAAALLWRLELLGIDTGARWRELSTAWAQYAEDHVLVFNDLHIAMSLAGAGDNAAANRLAQSVANYAAAEHGTNATVSRQFGLPAIQALLAFRNGDYARTAALLAPIYKNLAPIGGSNAQRDLVIQTLGIAAFKTGDIALAQAVAAERKRLKTGRPRAWSAYAVLH
jgi:tetratricopeptide (TPR) repeat protein